MLAHPHGAGLGWLRCCSTSGINQGAAYPSAPQLPQYTPVPVSPKSQSTGTEGVEGIADACGLAGGLTGEQCRQGKVLTWGLWPGDHWRSMWSEHGASGLPHPARQRCEAAGGFGCSQAPGPPSPEKLMCPCLQKKDDALFTALELVGL